jgi:excisionase family DNA binding protein
MSEDRALTVRQVAERLQLGIQRVYSLIHSGKLTGRRLGGSIRVLPLDLATYLDAASIRPVDVPAAARPRGVRLRRHSYFPAIA